MPLPIWLKDSLPFFGSALAGFATAAWLLPSTAPPPASPSAAAGPVRSALGRPTSRPAPATVQGYLDALRQAGTPGQQMAAALQFASLTDPDEIRALLDQSNFFPAHAAGPLAAQTLLKRWLELDPAAALDYSRLHFEKSLPKLLGTWSVTHPAEAEAWILALPGSQTKIQAWQELCATTATRDPEKAWELLARSPSQAGSDGSYDARNLVEKLTARDLEGTIARLATMPAMLIRAAREAISKQLTETDPARGWEWARQQPNPNSLIGNAIGATMKQDPAQALAWLATLPGAQRKRVSMEYGYNWGGGDSATLAAALSGNVSFTAEEKKELARGFFNHTSGRDPERAEAFLPLLGEAELPQYLNSYLKSRSRKTGNTETEAWIAGLAPGPVRTAAETAWKEQRVPETPEDRSTPASLVSEFKKNSYIEETDPRLPLLNMAEVRGLMADQSGAKAYYSKNILTSLAKTNPAPAAAWLASVPVDARTGPQAAQFSATWAQEDPVAAAAWVTSLPAGDLATNAAGNVARQFHRYAPVEAKTWLKSLPPGPARDAARQAMSGL